MNYQQELFRACGNGDLQVVKYLIEKGIDVETKDNHGGTSLIKSVWHGKINVIKYLIEEKGANIEVRDNRGNTALLYAVCRGYFDIIKYLIEEVGVNIEDRDDENNTPLIYSSLFGNIEITKFLIEKGANTLSKDYLGKTFIEYLDETQEEEINRFIEDIQLRKAMIKPHRK